MEQPRREPDKYDLDFPDYESTGVPISVVMIWFDIFGGKITAMTDGIQIELNTGARYVYRVKSNDQRKDPR